MITKQEFTDIHKEVQDAIQEVLDNLKQKYPNNYALFLAKGEYNLKFENTQHCPYVIDTDGVERYKDFTRFSFLTSFLSEFYSFRLCQKNVDDVPFRMNIELMIYTHIWESKPFLKELYRLAHLANGEDYNWNVIVPDMGKHDFIRKDIRDTFCKTSTKMEDVIKKGFHTSLRNAFAHSEFYFNTMNGKTQIVLENYKGANWELPDISFDEWSKRFVYSALLSYFLLKLTLENRKKIITDLGTSEFTISIAIKSSQNKTIVYDNQRDDFYYKQS